MFPYAQTQAHIYKHRKTCGIYPAPCPRCCSEPACDSAECSVGPHYWFLAIKAGTLVNQSVREPVSQKAIKQPVRGLGWQVRRSESQTLNHQIIHLEGYGEWKHPEKTKSTECCGSKREALESVHAKIHPVYFYTSRTANIPESLSLIQIQDHLQIQTASRAFFDRNCDSLQSALWHLLTFSLHQHSAHIFCDSFILFHSCTLFCLFVTRKIYIRKDFLKVLTTLHPQAGTFCLLLYPRQSQAHELFSWEQAAVFSETALIKPRHLPTLMTIYSLLPLLKLARGV